MRFMYQYFKCDLQYTYIVRIASQGEDTLWFLWSENAFKVI